ncbi:MAG TPA: Nif3-like dinuclear metal center hexameric protein [Spirochaetota bacterium]|nr:Nif3-like dinuclear metal center hexameric protein [Spirochaetota bacterium]
MVTRTILSDWLDEYLRVSEVPDYAPNGLQIEGKAEIGRIIAAVSINREVIEKAVAEKADAILVHHGMFWKNEDAALRGYRKERVKLILQHDINLFAYHLPLDVHPEIGHNNLILKGIGAAAGPPEEGSYGRRGSFHTPLGFGELVERLNSALHTEARYFHNGKESIETVYVVSGAGRNEIERVCELGVDAYITGDAKESTPYVSREAGMNYIFAGHYNTERLGIVELSKIIAEQFGVDARFVDVDNTL